MKLVETADVFVENFRPGVMDRPDCRLEETRSQSQLIYFITGFGEDGPYEKRPAYEP